MTLQLFFEGLNSNLLQDLTPHCSKCHCLHLSTSHSNWGAGKLWNRYLMSMVFHIETSTSGGLVIHRAYASLNLLRRVTVTCACFFFLPINQSNLMGWMHTYTNIKQEEAPQETSKGRSILSRCKLLWQRQSKKWGSWRSWANSSPRPNP